MEIFRIKLRDNCSIIDLAFLADFFSKFWQLCANHQQSRGRGIFGQHFSISNIMQNLNFKLKPRG
jgi:hypothetical protein